MTFLDLWALALGVAMDAVAVSLAQGLRMRRPRVRDAVVVAAFFGTFQGLMPLIGWTLSSRFATVMSTFAPWVASLLLVGVGVHMLREAWSHDDGHDTPDPEAVPDRGPATPAGGGAVALVTRRAARPAVRALVVLAVATSVDALAVGAGLGLVHAPVGTAIPLMAGVTFVLSAVAVLLGARLGERLGRWAEIAGGLVLVAIAVRLLITHLLTS